MYTFAKTTAVTSHISQEQLSEVLKIKARNPIGFIPGITKFEVVEELDPTEGNIFTCKFIFYGESFEDKVTIFPPSHVLHEFNNRPGSVENTISDDNEGKVYLTFTFRLSNKTDEDKARITTMKEAAVKALSATVEKAEKFAKEGKI